MTEERRLILLLGDQLSPDMSSLRSGRKTRDVVLLTEVAQEATYVRHHQKKLVLVLSAMRHFADELRGQGWHVDYVMLEDPENSGTLDGEVIRALGRHACDRVIVTEAGEWRLLQSLRDLSARLSVPMDILEDERFLCTHADFAAFAQDRKVLRLGDFYREMRRRTGLLMDGARPAGGRWSYDADNRKRPRTGMAVPDVARFAPDETTADVLALVGRRFADHFGSLEPFWFAVTRSEAEQALDRFITAALPRFGDYQDAMLRDRRFLYHSVLSAYINVGLLDPLAVCRRVEAAYRGGRVPLNAAEGFIRQIIGWREFVRGVYWREMPDYATNNFFGAARTLPRFYWTGETEMACLAACITQTRDEAYAHHIQRLMVTGTFAMLAGVDPKQVHEWYLAVYADAFEWVELPNSLGMSQFADGGLLATKPYAASGSYIDRMSDYCKGCRYAVKQKTGEDACPFNYLYWDFLARHRDVLRNNPRLAQAFRTWDRMEARRKVTTKADAKRFLERLDRGDSL